MLFEPLDGILRRQNFETGWVSFRVQIPDAAKVAVIVEDDDNDNKYHQMSFADGEWFVRVYLEQYFDKGKNYKAKVSAVLPKSEKPTEASNSYWSMLEYIIE